ncbi:phage holin family protein [Aeromicrobium massiliense]|uniref:phage holin family protein n=1 Tax=Aeromicrobium massiliense TaxID=1464554 RepID=UPI0002E3DCB8|nr:phage holin family protein [Aeromicrobium massiliense]
MPALLVTWISSAVSLAVAAWLLGDHMNIAEGGAESSTLWLTLAVVSAVFALINVYVKPVLNVLSLPFIILTLGLALLIINALLLLLTEWIAGQLDLSFSVDGFGWAILASIVISIVNAVVSAIID